MSQLQSALRRFDERIKLDWFDEQALLREKRDRILDRMYGNGLAFTHFNQGSYAMRLGVRPVRSDYDIDVGVVLTDVNPQMSPIEAKRQVFEAVDGHTSQVEWMTHCIRVQYRSRGEEAYHVDLAVYRARAGRSSLELAVGKQYASDPGWQASDPKGLLEAFGNKWSGQDLEQFRRVVRVLKRWKDLNFPPEGHAMPVGIGIAMSAYHRFNPVKDDAQALYHLVSSMLGSFRPLQGPDGQTGRRMLEKVPVSPYDNVYRKMTNQQMKVLEDKLHRLKGALEQASTFDEPQPLVKELGQEVVS